MPKGKRKKGGRASADSRHMSDDEADGVVDGASVLSVAGSDNVSDAGSSVSDIVGALGNGVDELSAQEQFEEKLKDCIDGLTDKSMKTRQNHLVSLNQAMSKKYIPNFVINRKVTICDSLERCLKKGKGEEQSSAAINMVLLCIQLGMGADSESIYADIKPVISTILLDNTASPKARASCATALGLCTFISSSTLEQVQEVMHSLESVFKASNLKGDGVVPTYSPELSHLHCCALSSWTLLLSIAPPSIVEVVIAKHLPKLPELLQSVNVDMRIEAGQTIALCYELAREDDEDFEGDDIVELCETLKQLATDSHKYRAKKERQKQRANFRDITRAVEEGESPDINVKFGLESIIIDSWVRKSQYDALSAVLGSGTNCHLRENYLIREIFGLGDPIPSEMMDKMKSAKVSKVERHYYNSAAFKARTKIRQKSRDKRSAVFNS